MGVRARIGKGLEATMGKERTDRIRKAERRTRQQLADKLAPPPVERARPAGLRARLSRCRSRVRAPTFNGSVSLTTAKVAGFHPTRSCEKPVPGPEETH